MEVGALEGPFGAEVLGLDLTVPLGAGTTYAPLRPARSSHGLRDTSASVGRILHGVSARAIRNPWQLNRMSVASQ